MKRHLPPPVMAIAFVFADLGMTSIAPPHHDEVFEPDRAAAK
jgi:hypothetical protein